MAKFRKKPVVIDAVQLTEETMDDVLKWIAGYQNVEIATNLETDEVTGLFIETLEGQMFAALGDWIIQGVHKEFYPCKPDIFEETYEPAD